MMSHQQVRRAVLALVVALTLASCGSSSGGAAKATTSTTGASTPTSTTPTTATTATTAPTSTTQPLPTTEAAGKKYLALVAGPNCAIDNLGAKATEIKGTGQVTEAQWPKIQAELLPLFRRVSDENVHFYEGLVAQRWPAAVEADVQTLIGQLTTEAGQYRAVSESASYAAFESMTVPTAPNTAGVIRAKLGLKSNVTEKTTCAQG
jgi:hypothetical protein